MTSVNLENWQSQLRKGLLDIVILNVLQQTGRSHGYEMVQQLKRIQGLKIREGNIYPIFARLESEGLVDCRQEASTEGPPRKYYQITPLGVQTIAEMNQHWAMIIESIAAIREGTSYEHRK